MKWASLALVPLCISVAYRVDRPLIIPAVREWEASDPANFTFDTKDTRVVCDASLIEVAKLFQYDFASRYSILPTLGIIERGASAANEIYFRLAGEGDDLEKLGDEGYKLEISDRITVTAKTDVGYRRAAMTIIQMAGSDSIPQGTIHDYPESKKRWLSLDCARHFFPYEYIKDTIKLLSYYKMNGIILHGVDAEAFRFETVSHPELPTAGGYYTKAQIIDLSRTGRLYGVDVIPGFEFPGHSTAFNLAFGTGLPEECAAGMYPWVTKDWIMDITHPKSLQLTQEVLTDVLRWFPSPYVHLGADELPDVASFCEPVRKYLEANSELGSYADMIADWTASLADWLKKTLGKEAIIYNGLEKGVRKKDVPKNAIIQFWDEPEGGTYLSDYYLANNYKVLNSHPAQDIFYLTPNAYHYIFPDLELLMEKGLASSLPPNATIEGYVFNIWCDYIYWLDEDYIETHAALPRAMIAAMAWNSDVSRYPDVPTFARLLDDVGPAPMTVRLPEAKEKNRVLLHELHHYSFEPADYEPTVLKSCPDPLCLFIKDNIGTLHGSTYIADPSEATNSLVKGKYGRALRWNDMWAKEGVGFGGVDISPPWTWSAWIRLDEKTDSMPLFWSRKGALMLGTPEHGNIGVTTFPDPLSMCHYTVSANFPADMQFHHLLFTAAEGEELQIGRVEVYIDGIYQGMMTLDFDLPMAAIMGYLPLDAPMPTQTLMTIDEVRVLRGYALQEDVNRLQAIPPAVAVNNPPDWLTSEVGPIFSSLRFVSLYFLYLATQ